MIPPLFWNKDFICIRFIPAGAGNTLFQRHVSLAVAVYPRWRGEHPLPVVNHSSSGGLSPLARGTLRPPAPHFAILRFIPAGAGNTITLQSSTPLSPVYPRWRGEHSINSIATCPDFGLSPLARGTQPPDHPHRNDTRFIPAGAGNTYDAFCEKDAIPVYPRWRGEHADSTKSLPDHFGLSPLARGTR